MARTYDMTRRARAAALTSERILSWAEALLTERPIGEVTLEAIAQRAGVTVQTVLRHVGSREGCWEAVKRRVEARVEIQRRRSAPGDVNAAIDDVLAHYETEGRLVLNLLAQERTSDEARDAVERGRAYHRAWVERCFGALITRRGAQRRRAVDALVLATDLYTWKLLRLDLGRSLADAKAVIKELVEAVLAIRELD